MQLDRSPSNERRGTRTRTPVRIRPIPVDQAPAPVPPDPTFRWQCKLGNKWNPKWTVYEEPVHSILVQEYDQDPKNRVLQTAQWQHTYTIDFVAMMQINNKKPHTQREIRYCAPQWSGTGANAVMYEGLAQFEGPPVLPAPAPLRIARSIVPVVGPHGRPSVEPAWLNDPTRLSALDTLSRVVIRRSSPDVVGPHGSTTEEVLCDQLCQVWVRRGWNNQWIRCGDCEYNGPGGLGDPSRQQYNCCCLAKDHELVASRAFSPAFKAVLHDCGRHGPKSKYINGNKDPADTDQRDHADDVPPWVTPVSVPMMQPPKAPSPAQPKAAQPQPAQPQTQPLSSSTYDAVTSEEEDDCKIVSSGAGNQWGEDPWTDDSGWVHYSGQGEGWNSATGHWKQYASVQEDADAERAEAADDVAEAAEEAEEEDLLDWDAAEAAPRVRGNRGSRVPGAKRRGKPRHHWRNHAVGAVNPLNTTLAVAAFVPGADAINLCNSDVLLANWHIVALTLMLLAVAAYTLQHWWTTTPSLQLKMPKPCYGMRDSPASWAKDLTRSQAYKANMPAYVMIPWELEACFTCNRDVCECDLGPPTIGEAKGRATRFSKKRRDRFHARTRPTGPHSD